MVQSSYTSFCMRYERKFLMHWNTEISKFLLAHEIYDVNLIIYSGYHFTFCLVEQKPVCFTPSQNIVDCCCRVSSQQSIQVALLILCCRQTKLVLRMLQLHTLPPTALGRDWRILQIETPEVAV